MGSLMPLRCDGTYLATCPQTTHSAPVDGFFRLSLRSNSGFNYFYHLAKRLCVCQDPCNISGWELTSTVVLGGVSHTLRMRQARWGRQVPFTLSVCHCHLETDKD